MSSAATDTFPVFPLWLVSDYLNIDSSGFSLSKGSNKLGW
jgi:hypothetical protein